ncbi:MAG: hypothetical protein LC135_10510 [Phycisphaerae bacterium]|nr:hypothetical protein [Phycisphaerae bacterium]MCZ2400280.1 hypothetical protein [Phycisphaerae bacterium]
MPRSAFLSPRLVLAALAVAGVTALAVATAAITPVPVAAQSANATPPATPASQPAAAAPAMSRIELERRLAETLHNATLKGAWQMTRFDEHGKPATLGEPSRENYTIQSARKDEGDFWIITARIQFGERDVTLPVRVRVLWAGDTPILTLDDLELPLLGKYSARVMIHRDFYSGTWFGAGYGGVMCGQIVREAAEAGPRP